MSGCKPQVFVRESSMVPIYSVLLFGGELTVLHDRGLLKVKVQHFPILSISHMLICTLCMAPRLGW